MLTQQKALFCAAYNPIYVLFVLIILLMPIQSNNTKGAQAYCNELGHPSPLFLMLEIEPRTSSMLIIQVNNLSERVRLVMDD